MLFNINISPVNAAPGAAFNINVQIEAPDLVQALEAAKEPIRKSAEASANQLAAALPAPTPPQEIAQMWHKPATTVLESAAGDLERGS